MSLTEKKDVLSHSCWIRNPAIVKLRLDYGAYANQQDQEGNTPLHVAVHAKANILAIMKLLFADKAKVGITKNEGNTPLHLAACGKDFSIVALLIEHKAPVNALNNNKETPLNRSGCCDSLIIKILLENGASVTWKIVEEESQCTKLQLR